MKTREEYLADVSRPGKFEGESPWAPYFYDLLMDGGADSDDDGVATFEIQSEDVAMFPELAGYDHATVFEDDLGFFYCTLE